MIVKKFIQIFNKVGGKEILKQYWRAHVLLFALMQTVLNGFSKKSLELVRLSVQNRILGKLRKKYRRTVEAFRASPRETSMQHSNKVWVCWLQGMENAPALVQRCYRSLQEQLSDRELIVLTEENYRDYVTFPQHINEKIQSGIITRTHMSDLLRLELLIRYGGTWIDATVFCSGGKIPTYMLDSELFFFQALKPGADGHAVVMSSWFLTACTAHPVLELTRTLLYRYWEKKKAMVDYFLLHDFFQLALEAYPQEWEKVMPVCNSTPHILLLRLFEAYDPQQWEALCCRTPFHKLTYKFAQEQTQLEDTFYSHVLGGQKHI